jgi:hypothetical protein
MIENNRAKRKFEPPVAWLLGRDLIASLQGTLLYTAFGGKLDPRAWMKAEEIPLGAALKDENEFWFDYIADSGDGMKATYSIAYLALSSLYLKKDLEKIPRDEIIDVSLKKSADETMILPRGAFLLVGGDTSYHLSDYATLGSRFYKPFRWAFEDRWNDLEVEGTPEANEKLENLKIRRPLFGIPGNHDYYDQLDGFRRQFRQPVISEKDGGLSVQLPASDDTDLPELMLPGFRCRQSASYIGLKLPFGWCLWGLDTEVGLIDEQQQQFFLECRKKAYEEELKRWKWLKEKHEKWKETRLGDEPENPGDAPKEEDCPRKLILATCSPSTFFGRFAQANDKKSAEAIAQLNLCQPFMPKEGNEDLSQLSGDAILRDGQCRLDLSGDYHLYARYWGPTHSESSAPRSDPNVPRPAAESYASVISGLGGAFHHPSQTFHGDLMEQALYPSEKDSRAVFSKRLFSFQNVFRGGGVGILGFCLAFVIYFSATLPKSSRQAVENGLAALPAGFAQTVPEPIQKTVVLQGNAAKPANAAPNDSMVQKTQSSNPAQKSGEAPREKLFIDPPWLWRGLFGVEEKWNPNQPVIDAGNALCKDQKDLFFFGPCRIAPPPYYWLSPVLVAFSLALFIVAARLFPRPGKTSKEIVRNEKHEIDVTEDPAEQHELSGFQATEKTAPGDAPSVLQSQSLAVRFGNFVGSYRQLLYLFITAASACILFAGLTTIRPYRLYITPFGQSMLVFSTLIWGAVAVVLSIIYSDWLFKQASVREIRRRDWILTWSLLISSALIFSAGLWWFATNNIPAYIVTDITLVLATFGMAILIILLAVFIGGGDHNWKHRLGIFLPFGVWHAVLQIATPYLLVRKGTWQTFAAAAALSILFWLVGRYLMKQNQRVILVLCWAVYGFLMLALPYITFHRTPPPCGIQKKCSYQEYRGFLMEKFQELHADDSSATTTNDGAPVSQTERMLVFPTAAGLIGLFTSCIWLGWYLAVSLCFHGHNNEAGGAGRVEAYKEFIRFRVRENDITGYVIAVNEPKKKGIELQPKLIDVFTLKVKGKSPAGFSQVAEKT